MNAIHEAIRAAEQRAEKAEAALREAAEILEWLAENEPDCLGWTGHNEPTGPWSCVAEAASRARAALNGAP